MPGLIIGTAATAEPKAAVAAAGKAAVGEAGELLATVAPAVGARAPSAAAVPTSEPRPPSAVTAVAALPSERRRTRDACGRPEPTESRPAPPPPLPLAVGELAAEAAAAAEARRLSPPGRSSDLRMRRGEPITILPWGG